MKSFTWRFFGQRYSSSSLYLRPSILHLFQIYTDVHVFYFCKISFFLYYIISRSCHIYFYDFFLYCIWFHICIVHSNYLFNGFFTALEKNIAKHIIPFQRSAPKHRQYVAETRETKLNNERQRKNECHTSVIDSRCPSRCFRQFPGYFSKIRPICFLFIYQLDLSTWFEMGCILVVWVGALKSWNLDDFFQVHWATIDLDSF